MTKKSDAPAIRFKGFSDAWEQRKLSEMCGTFEYGLNAAAKEFDGKNKYIRITDIDDASREFLLSDLSSPDICLDGMSKYLLSSGDIVFARTGASVGKTYIYRENDGIVYFAGFLIRAKVKQDNNAEFVFQSTLSPSYEKYIRITSQRSGQPGVNAQEYGEYDLFAPSKEEQQRIGHFLQGIDNLITLHQRKCANLCSPSQVVFSLLFATSTFSWEQRKFDEVFDCTVPNNTLSRAELSYDEGTVLNVHYGDVLIKYGSVLDVQKDDIPRIPHRCREDFNGALLQDGDVIIADTAEDETTGKACEIGNLQGSAIVSGLHTMVCRPRNRMALGYLGYYLNSNAYHHQLLPLMQGIKVLSLSRSNIQKTSVSYPIAVKEQQLIAYYFSQLDNLITLHQRECISFTGRADRLILTANKKRTTSSWEQRKLSEITDKVTEKNAGLQYVETFTNSAEFGIISQRDFFDHDIAKLGSLDGYYIVKNEDFVYNPRISTSAPVGPINRNKLGRTGVMSPLYTVFRPHDIDTTYLEYFFKCGYWHSFMNFNGDSGARSDRFSIRDNVFFQMPIPIPDIDEQRKIGELLTCLDNLITLHQRKPFLMKWRTSDANRNQTNRLVL